MKTAEDVLNVLLNQGYSLTEIMCSVNDMEKKVNPNNKNTYSLKSIGENFRESNDKFNQ